MSKLYKAPSPGLGSKSTLLIGVVCAILVFLLVPIAQLFKESSVSVDSIEAVEFAPVPPPQVIEELVDPVVEEEPPPPLDLNKPPPMPTLEMLELSLNPGLGGDLSLDSSIDFDIATETVEQMSQLFGFDELDQIPRLMRQGRPKMQQSAEFQRLMRRQADRQVVLEVTLNEQGVVEVQNVQSATHEALIPAAKQAAEGSRFSPPMRNGQAVRARYTWPLSF
ncbi:MAG: TonB family protein [Opitutaceae bacterium]